MKKINWVLCYGLVVMLFGCASADKVELTSTDSLELAVAEVEGLMTAADIDQAELLSYKEYTNGSEYLAKAQRGLSRNYQVDYIQENTAKGKAQLQEALKNTRDRSANAIRILEARRSALDAGLRDSPVLVSALADVDDDVRDETDDFASSLDPVEFSEFQKKYFSLEVKAVQFRELDAVKKAIQKASREDAESLAPKSLRTALLDVSEAENLIAQSPRDSKVYQVILDLAVESSVFLADVMDVISDAPGTPEDIASQIVEQNRELEALSANVGNLKQNLKTTQSTLMESESALVLQNQELEKSSRQVRFQYAMDQAVKEFPDKEASVYQQGSKLIFRLKKINFASGSATIPAASKPLLSKINHIIKSVGAELVAVEGHTDSIGSAELNKVLSTKRAISVANYLAALAGGYKIGYLGYGESRPIASNETKEGRAINRRVDLVVTARK